MEICFELFKNSAFCWIRRTEEFLFQDLCSDAISYIPLAFFARKALNGYENYLSWKIIFLPEISLIIINIIFPRRDTEKRI
jgi:hypothetical protein